MSKKLIIRLSNNIGNQMFMYAAGYSFSKQMQRKLLVDEQTSFSSKKNIYKYELDLFNFTSRIASDKYKFLKFSGYLKRKIIKKIDKFSRNKNFYIEPRDHEKISSFKTDFLNKKYANNLFIEGHFESEKYFENYKDEIFNEFTFKYRNKYIENPYYKLINDTDSVALCLRQNRFSENVRKSDSYDDQKSKIFVDEQIKFIKKSIDIIKSKLSNPKFFIWSNYHKNLSEYFPDNTFTIIKNDNVQLNNSSSILDLFLMTQAKHFVVIPSCYNWWGCWLSHSKNKIVLRPSNENFSLYKNGNRDFWPKSWLKV